MIRTESLLESLSELKAIEDQRLADEQAAVLRMRELARREREDAELAVRAAEAAKLAAAHAVEVELHKARAEAEREVRLRVEASEAAERARSETALEDQRAQFERELRREYVRRVRPRWMIAVTAISLCAAAAAGGLAWQRQGAIGDAERVAHAADQRAAEAALIAHAIDQRFDRQLSDLAALATKIDLAVGRVLIAQREADAQAQRDADARQRKAMHDRKVRDDKAIQDALDAERKGGLHLSEECIGQAVCREVKDGPKAKKPQRR